MPTNTTLSAALGATLFASAANAGAPAYDNYELYLRGNFATNPGGAFNIPGNNFIANETVGLNENGDISVRISPSSFGGPSVWAGDVDTGSVIYTAAGSVTMSTTSLNENGRIIWVESFGSLDGIYGVDIDGANAGIVTNRPVGASSWANARINDSGKLGHRAGIGFAGNALVIVEANGTDDTIVAAEDSVDFQFPWSFIFTPDFNNNDQIAAKLRVGPSLSDSQPDEIRLFEIDGSSTLLAEDADANPMSIFEDFDNSLALNDIGQVAFVSDIVGGGRGVFRTDGTTVTTIATTNGPELSEIEFFAPDMNDDGIVVFRAFDGDGLRAIWAGNGDWLTRVVTENDILPTDLGDARVDQESAGNPVFGGGPTINNAGHVAFTAGLTPPDDNQTEWGTGVFVVTPTLAGPCLGDCDGSGTVDFNDLTAMLFEFGASTDGPCDADGSGTVDFNDLTSTLFLFGPCPE
jgi:hypothetical protein